jgi:hypothetical protein
VFSRLVSAVNIHCLRRALSSHDNSGLVFVDRLLLSSIFHCSKDDDHVMAMDDLKAAFSCKWSSATCTIALTGLQVFLK